jgi:putative transposase
VARRLRTLGLEPRSPTPRTSEPHPAQRMSPYWLRGVPITRGHPVGSTDITDSRLHGGFRSLGAVMDWCSRSGLSWAGSITMEVGFGLEALEHALEGARPDIGNREHGAQGTRLDFTGRLAAAGIQMRMDG